MVLWLHVCSQLLSGASSCLLRHLWLQPLHLRHTGYLLVLSPADTLQTMGLSSPELHSPGFITLTHTHTFYIVKHCERARVSKAGSETVQTTTSQRFLPTVPENEKCSRLGLTAFSFKCDFSILSSPQASKMWCINMNSKEISELCQ